MRPVVRDAPVKFHDPRLNRSQEIEHVPVGGDILDRFFNFDNCQPEVASDLISCMAVQYVGVDVCVKFGDSRSNRSQDIRLPHFVTEDNRTTRPVRRTLC